MSILKKENTGPGKIKLLIAVAPKDYEKYLKDVVASLQNKHDIPGFRRGNVPYNIAKRHFGEMKLINEALDDIINDSYREALIETKFHVALPPRITLKKLAYGSDIEYEAEIVLFPHITLPNVTEIVIEKKEAAANQQEVDQLLEEIRRDRASETRKSEGAALGDRVEFDIETALSNSDHKEFLKNQTLILDKEKLISGFAESIVGIKEGEEKEFVQRFPAKYEKAEYQNQDVIVKIKAHAVWDIVTPEANDEFAKSLNSKEFSTIAVLKEHLKANLQQEKEIEERARQERELIQKVINKSAFSDIAPELLEDTKQKMASEVKRAVLNQGVKWDDYLSRIGKTETAMREMLEEEAESRIKFNSLMAHIIQQEELSVNDEEVKEEANKFLLQFKSVKDAHRQIKPEELTKSVYTSLLNRKAIEYLKKQVKL